LTTNGHRPCLHFERQNTYRLDGPGVRLCTVRESLDRDLESVLQAYLGLRWAAPDSTFQGSSSMHPSCARFSTHRTNGRQLAPPVLGGSNYDHGALLKSSACRSSAVGTRLVKRTLQAAAPDFFRMAPEDHLLHMAPSEHSFALSGFCICRLQMRSRHVLLTVDLVSSSWKQLFCARAGYTQSSMFSCTFA